MQLSIIFSWEIPEGALDAINMVLEYVHRKGYVQKRGPTDQARIRLQLGHGSELSQPWYMAPEMKPAFPTVEASVSSIMHRLDYGGKSVAAIKLREMVR